MPGRASKSSALAVLMSTNPAFDAALAEDLAAAVDLEAEPVCAFSKPKASITGHKLRKNLIAGIVTRMHPCCELQISPSVPGASS